MFPSGPAGVALLLRRLSVASLIVAMLHLNFPPQWLSVGIAIVAVALLVGLSARFAAALCAAFALLGVGAYSIDARLFGRRVITF
jgi:hypothetical protein